MKSKLSFLIIVFMLLIVFTGCSKKSPTDVDSNKDADVDGNTYQTIKIGDQYWMAENLKVTHYRDGTPIANITDREEWRAQSTGAYCAFNNDEDLAEIFGYLYNWYAVNDKRNIAPEGWHVPNEDEWLELEKYLGLSSREADQLQWRGIKVGIKLKETGTAYWSSPNAYATNESGFTALAGGCRDSGYFVDCTYSAYFWSSIAHPDMAWYRHLHVDQLGVWRSRSYRSAGMSVRLIRD